MIRFNFKKSKGKVRKELASEIVEILEEKLDEIKIEVPKNVLEMKDEQVKFKEDFRKELVCEIADFISINTRVFSKRKAA